MNKHDQQVIHSSKESCYRTPPALFKALNKEFEFQYDLAADSSNYLCSKWVGPDHPLLSMRDALAMSWHTLIGPFFLNPPYSREGYRQSVKAGQPNEALVLENWIFQCYMESQVGAVVASLVPAAVQTKWWKNFVLGHNTAHRAAEIRFIPHRISYLGPNGEKLSNAGVNSCVIIWKPNPGYIEPWSPTVRWWDYDE